MVLENKYSFVSAKNKHLWVFNCINLKNFNSMFYVIGLGLGDAEDITFKGFQIVKKCHKVYLENYTSILTVGCKKLEEFYGRQIILADREMVEQGCDAMLDEAKDEDVALLVVGDPFGATTHVDILLRAKEKGVNFQVVHNASIMNAVGCCGLQLYSFGETISIPFWTDTWEPDSFYPRIASNRERGLHTLCLLDIKVKEPTLESLTKKTREYMPPRFMTVAEASAQLLAILTKHKNDAAFDENTYVVGLARVGSPSQQIIYTTLTKMSQTNLGDPLHSLIIPGDLQPLEIEYLSQFAPEPSC